MEPPVSGGKELWLGVFNSWWEILACKVVVEFEEEAHRLGQECIVGYGGWTLFCEEKRRSLTKQLKKWIDELCKDEVDLGKQGVGSDVGTPVAEDGVCGLEHADVDVVVCRGEGRY